MTRPDSITTYRLALIRVYEETGSLIPKTSPLGMVSSDIREMITSYLSDAASFHVCNDIVNEYASLAYAHGWLDAARYLGFLDGEQTSLILPDDGQFPALQHERLIEKTGRYEKMLNEAISSVLVAPQTGSPLYQAAMFIAGKATDAGTGIRAVNSGDGYAAVLGELSYAYGWLDAGVRAGLFRVTGNPHLFTTEITES